MKQTRLNQDNGPHQNAQQKPAPEHQPSSISLWLSDGTLPDWRESEARARITGVVTFYPANQVWIERAPNHYSLLKHAK